MKWFEYVYSYGKEPTTRTIYIKGDTAEQIAEILSHYGGKVSADAIHECSTETVEQIHQRRISTKDVMTVVRGELV